MPARYCWTSAAPRRAETGTIDKGLFLFPLAYDDSTQQHKLASVSSQTAMQMPLLVQAAQQMSRTAGGSWFERQNDLRGNLDNVGYGGAWGRLTHEEGERDARQTQGVFDTEFNYNNDFDQDTTAVTVGQDFVFGNIGERAWVVGGMAGYVRSQVAFDRTLSRIDLEGANLGLYGSYIAGPWFVDAALTHAWLTGDGEFPSLNRTATGGFGFQRASARTAGNHLRHPRPDPGRAAGERLALPAEPA